MEQFFIFIQAIGTVFDDIFTRFCSQFPPFVLQGNTCQYSQSAPAVESSQLVSCISFFRHALCRPFQILDEQINDFLPRSTFDICIFGLDDFSYPGNIPPKCREVKVHKRPDGFYFCGINVFLTLSYLRFIIIVQEIIAAINITIRSCPISSERKAISIRVLASRNLTQSTGNIPPHNSFGRRFGPIHEIVFLQSFVTGRQGIFKLIFIYPECYIVRLVRIRSIQKIAT